MNDAGFSPIHIDEVRAVQTVGAASGAFVSISGASSAIHSYFKKRTMINNVNNLSKKLTSFLEMIYKSVEKATSEKAPPTGQAQQEINIEEMERAIRTLEYLYTLLMRLNNTAESKNLTNFSQMVPALRNIRTRTEELRDLADWLQTFLDNSPADVRAVFSSARAELEADQVYDLAQVR